MEINRENYEGYFLMYADNELTDSQKTEVWLFLKENNDLEEEFRRIMQTISSPSPGTGLLDKSFLYKAETVEGIGQENFEEMFVLYHDGELNSLQMDHIHHFLEQNPRLRELFHLIGKARLAPEETVHFPGKQDLYHKRGRRVVIRPMIWTLAGAAAILFWGWWTLARYSAPENRAMDTHFPIARTGGKHPSFPEKVPVDLGHTATIPAPNRSTALVSPGHGSEKSGLVKAPEGQSTVHIEGRKQESAHNTSTELVVRDVKGIAYSRRLTPASSSLEQQARTEISTSQEAPLRMSPQEQVVTAGSEDNRSPGSAVGNSATPSLQALKDPGQDYAYYAGNESQFNRTQVGGFLKKVRRIIRRNNPINRIFGENASQ